MLFSIANISLLLYRCDGHYIVSLCVQASVDEEVNLVVQSMLYVLLDCFTRLTEKTDKVPPTVVSGQLSAC